MRRQVAADALGPRAVAVVVGAGAGRAVRSPARLARSPGGTSRCSAAATTSPAPPTVCDLLVLAVPDAAVAEVAAAVAPGPAVVAHLSGSLGLAPLAGHARRAVLHPLVSLPDADVGAAAAAWRRLVRPRRRRRPARRRRGRRSSAVGPSPSPRATGPRYHAAAVIASNHLVGLARARSSGWPPTIGVPARRLPRPGAGVARQRRRARALPPPSPARCAGATGPPSSATSPPCPPTSERPGRRTTCRRRSDRRRCGCSRAWQARRSDGPHASAAARDDRGRSATRWRPPAARWASCPRWGTCTTATARSLEAARGRRAQPAGRGVDLRQPAAVRPHRGPRRLPPRPRARPRRCCGAAGVDHVLHPSVEEMYPFGTPTLTTVTVAAHQRRRWRASAAPPTSPGSPPSWPSSSPSSGRAGPTSARRTGSSSPSCAAWPPTCRSRSRWWAARRCASPTASPCRAATSTSRADERAAAPALHRALLAGAAPVEAGERDPAAVRAAMHAVLDPVHRGRGRLPRGGRRRHPAARRPARRRAALSVLLGSAGPLSTTWRTLGR